VRLSFVAGPPRGSAFIGGNSDRVGDESSSQKAGGSCASGVACGAMTSNGRAQWVALKNPALGRGRCAPPRRLRSRRSLSRLASCGEDWHGYEDQLGQFPNFGRCRSTGTRLSHRLATQAQFVRSESISEKSLRAYSRWLTSLFRGRCAWLTMACSKTLPSLFATSSRTTLKHFSTPRD
jgi:hypothetical protein